MYTYGPANHTARYPIVLARPPILGDLLSVREAFWTCADDYYRRLRPEAHDWPGDFTLYMGGKVFATMEVELSLKPSFFPHENTLR